MTDVTGNGEQGQAKTAAPDTAGSSRQSQGARKGKRRTGSVLDVRDQLEIFQQAAVDLEKVGISVEVGNVFDDGVMLLLTGVQWCPRCHYIRLKEEMSGNFCQYCTE